MGEVALKKILAIPEAEQRGLAGHEHQTLAFQQPES
jgi:hypothetical protein